MASAATIHTRVETARLNDNRVRGRTRVHARVLYDPSSRYASRLANRRCRRGRYLSSPIVAESRHTSDIRTKDEHSQLAPAMNSSLLVDPIEVRMDSVLRNANRSGNGLVA